MRDSKYSILFMRDDTDVRRYRISPFWLKAYVFAQVLLVLLAAGAMYVGFSSFGENATLRGDKRELTKKLEDAELRLSTLGNMEKILEAYDKSELQSLLAATPDTKEEAPAKTVDLAALFTQVDLGLVSVNEIKAHFDKKKLILEFKLENPKPDTVLAGEADLAIIARDGSIHPLESDKTDLTFQIQRRKFARTSATLPDGLSKKNAFGLRISIKRSDGKVIFSETFPLFNILT